jgi:cytidylate kinase
MRPAVSADQSTAHPTPEPPRGVVVAIDGPSGSGKSTVSRAVAERLGLRYLDTGAMYRALTWEVLRRGVEPADAAAVTAIARQLPLRVGTDASRPSMHLGDLEVTDAIRQPAVTAAVSAVSAIPEVRALLVARQRELIGDGGIVVEGRDIGTVVAPAAPVKVFLTASPWARAERRALELEGAASRRTIECTRVDLARRDAFDSSRPVAPLARADDALELDTTKLSMGEAVDRVTAAVARLAEPA